MHRSIRWLVGTLASILGLGLLLVRWGLWASDSRLVVENTPPVRSMLIAARKAPAFLIYAAVVFLLLVGFALLMGFHQSYLNKPRNGLRMGRGLIATPA